MLNTIATEPRPRRGQIAFDVEIAAVATAVPPNAIAQTDARDSWSAAYPQFSNVATIFDNTGIDTRYVCQPRDWYLKEHTWEERTEVFQTHALALLEEVAVDAAAQAGVGLDEIDALVVNTITGLAVPSLDARLMNRLPFSPNLERLPIFGIGCGCGVAGLSRAARIAQSIPGGNVLFLTVDLCTVCQRINDTSLTMFVSSALFGDGAAGVMLRNTANGGGAGLGGGLGRIVTTGDHFWGDTERIMGWDIKNDGFGVVLSPKLPSLMQERFAPALDGFLARNGLSRDDIEGYLLHPGGGKILDVADQVLGLAPDALEPSRETLRTHGNMSSATALFVLKYALDHGRRGRHVFAAFGPGFSAYFAILDL